MKTGNIYSDASESQESNGLDGWETSSDNEDDGKFHTKYK